MWRCANLNISPEASMDAKNSVLKGGKVCKMCTNVVWIVSLVICDDK